MGDECVEETGNDRYCKRRGLTSRNERGETRELFVWTLFFFAKAFDMQRDTIETAGMSVCEDRAIGNTLQSDGTRILEGATLPKSSEYREFWQIYSSLHFTIFTPHYQFS